MWQPPGLSPQFPFWGWEEWVADGKKSGESTQSTNPWHSITEGQSPQGLFWGTEGPCDALFSVTLLLGHTRAPRCPIPCNTLLGPRVDPVRPPPFATHMDFMTALGGPHIKEPCDTHLLFGARKDSVMSYSL